MKSPFWTSPELVTPNGTFTFPEPGLKTNFPRSYFLRCQAVEVRRCLQAGLKQSPRMSWDDSVLMHQILTDLRIKNGVVYPQDEAHI
jgi:dihydrodiol dehydrogenase / D-xylose 1-dehydrogenase (NADP)